VDNCTLSKERFDYARVLLATSSLEVLNLTDKILVDGVLVELKIIEEWGFSIGEDACLVEDDVDSKAFIPDNNFEHVIPKNREHVEDLINNLSDDWVSADKVTELWADAKVSLPLKEGTVQDSIQGGSSNEGRDLFVSVTKEATITALGQKEATEATVNNPTKALIVKEKECKASHEQQVEIQLEQVTSGVEANKASNNDSGNCVRKNGRIHVHRR